MAAGLPLKVWIALATLHVVSPQEQSSNTLGDFVKGLTNLISQNGGLGSLVNALPRPPSQYPGEYPQPGYAPGQYPGYGPGQYPGYGPGQYPGYAPAYPDGTYDGQRPYRPPHRPPPYRPGPPFRPPALPPGLYPYPGQYPPAGQGFLSALGSIAKYDDLRCVPRLLCEVTSGGKPGYPSYQGQQTTRDTITTLLTVLNFMDDNPLFIFGRAALLGAASRGNSAACLNAYPTCPKDPDRLVHYLNNHNGGFFRFFGGLPGTQQRGPGEDGEGAAPEEDGEARIQTRPSYQAVPAVHYPTRQPQAFKFQDSYGLPRPAEAQDYLPTTAHDQEYSPGYTAGRFVFPDRTPGRGGKQLSFPQDNRPAFSSYYKPNYSPPENLVNFRDQRSVKFPTAMSFPEN